MSSPREWLAFSRDETSVDPSARSSITPTQSLDSIVRGRALTLPMRLGVVAPVADHRVTAAPGTAHALRPTKLAHQREALGVVQQPREVDQVGCRHDRRLLA